MIPGASLRVLFSGPCGPLYVYSQWRRKVQIWLAVKGMRGAMRVMERETDEDKWKVVFHWQLDIYLLPITAIFLPDMWCRMQGYMGIMTETNLQLWDLGQKNTPRVAKLRLDGMMHCNFHWIINLIYTEINLTYILSSVWSQCPSQTRHQWTTFPLNTKKLLRHSLEGVSTLSPVSEHLGQFPLLLDRL